MEQQLTLEPIIVLKYGELSLKGKNRPDFVSRLRKNLSLALNGMNCKLAPRFDFFEINNFALSDLHKLLEILKLVPGISVIVVGYKLSRDLDLLCACASANISDNQTFKIECNRKDKSFVPTSLEIKKIVATYLFKNHTNLKVDLHHPQVTLFVEVLKNDFLIYVARYQGLGGLPVGVSGRVLVLLSGGIDSPVAAHYAMKRGMHVDFLTFITPPHTSIQSLEKTKQLSRIITHQGLLCDSKLYVCDFSSILHELNHCQPASYKITMMRRYFFKIAKQLCAIYNYDAIVTGEALGQVASQTIASMQVISAAAPSLFVVRPLIGFDKNDIINKAKQIKTFDLSILPFPDACTLFAPVGPVTHPHLVIAEKIEKDLDLTDILIANVITNHLTTMKVGTISDAAITDSNPNPK